jgi:hypothetical protein
MPEAAKGPRLWLRRERRDKRGRLTHPAMWYIRDDNRSQQSTGCGLNDRREAERCLADYICRRHLAAATAGIRDPSQIPVRLSTLCQRLSTGTFSTQGNGQSY